MKIRILFLIIFISLILGSFGCASKKDAPEGVPDFTQGDIILFLPAYYNEKTGCYLSSKPSGRLHDNPDFTVVNSFTSGENTGISFLLTLKPGKLFAFGGSKGLALFQYDEEVKNWRRVPYQFAEPSIEWENGGMVEEEKYYLNIGKEKCHFWPESPISIYSQNGIMDDGIYRLYGWGYEYDRNTLFLTGYIGDYVEFTWGPEE